MAGIGISTNDDLKYMSQIQPISAVSGRQRFTAVQQAEIAELAKRDREVRPHEARHLAAAGRMASARSGCAAGIGAKRAMAASAAGLTACCATVSPAYPRSFCSFAGHHRLLIRNPL